VKRLIRLDWSPQQIAERSRLEGLIRISHEWFHLLNYAEHCLVVTSILICVARSYGARAMALASNAVARSLVESESSGGYLPLTTTLEPATGRRAPSSARVGDG